MVRWQHFQHGFKIRTVDVVTSIANVVAIGGGGGGGGVVIVVVIVGGGGGAPL